MKNYTLLTLSVLIFGLFACKKDEAKLCCVSDYRSSLAGIYDCTGIHSYSGSYTSSGSDSVSTTLLVQVDYSSTDKLVVNGDTVIVDTLGNYLGWGGATWSSFDDYDVEFDLLGNVSYSYSYMSPSYYSGYSYEGVKR